MSNPPAMIDGVLASAAIAMGATLASWSATPNPPCTVTMFATSIPMARTAAKAKL